MSNAGTAPQVEVGADGGAGVQESPSEGFSDETESPASDPTPMPSQGEAASEGRVRPLATVAAGHGLLASPSFRMEVEVGRGVGTAFAQGQSIRMTSAAAFVEMEE